MLFILALDRIGSAIESNPLAATAFRVCWDVSLLSDSFAFLISNITFLSDQQKKASPMNIPLFLFFYMFIIEFIPLTFKSCCDQDLTNVRPVSRTLALTEFKIMF